MKLHLITEVQFFYDKIVLKKTKNIQSKNTEVNRMVNILIVNLEEGGDIHGNRKRIGNFSH